MITPRHDLIEDSIAISEKSRKELDLSRAEVKAGKVHSFEKVKRTVFDYLR